MNHKTAYTKLLPVLLLVASSSLFAQKGTSSTKETTVGTLTFTVKTVSNGTGYSPKHVLSIWIKDSLENFVVSKKVMAASRKKHLVKWVASSSYNTTTAITGSTLSSHQMHTITWDGKDASGTPVQDGVYQVWVEYTSQNSANGQPAGPSTSVIFHKGPVGDHVTPTNLTYFQDMVLDWVPAGVGMDESIRESCSVGIFPNPFYEKVNCKLSLKVRSHVQASVLDSSGKLIEDLIDEAVSKGEYAFSWSATNENGKKLSPGVYFLRLTINGKSIVEKLMKL